MSRDLLFSLKKKKQGMERRILLFEKQIEKEEKRIKKYEKEYRKKHCNDGKKQIRIYLNMRDFNKLEKIRKFSRLSRNRYLIIVLKKTIELGIKKIKKYNEI